MKKTLILGDTHGRSTWKLAVHQEQPNRVIFIGDYFDSFDISGVEQIDNFKQIKELWKKKGVGVGQKFNEYNSKNYCVDKEVIKKILNPIIKI